MIQLQTVVVNQRIQGFDACPRKSLKRLAQDLGG